MDRIEKLSFGKKVIIIFIPVFLLSLLSSRLVGSLYQNIFPSTTGGFGPNPPYFQGFFLSIPFWLGILGILFFATLRSYLLFILPAITIYLVFISQGSWEIFFKWVAPLLLITFGSGFLIGWLIKFIYKKFKD